MNNNLGGHTGDQTPQPNPQPPAQQAPAKKKDKNTIGLVAFIAAIIGFIFACIPGALIVGWVLLPVAFVLGLASLFLSGKSKRLGLAALLISIVGTIVGAVVFLTVVSTAFEEAFSDGETTTSQSSDSDAPGDDTTAAAPGTRDNPNPLGTTIKNDSWEVTVHSVDLNATKTLMAENLYNDEPKAGTVFIMVNLTAKYVGDDPDGEAAWVTVDYVTPDGNTVSSSDAFVSAPDEFDSLETLYTGASTRGNIALQVPADTADQGVLAVHPSLLGKKVFVAVK